MRIGTCLRVWRRRLMIDVVLIVGVVFLVGYLMYVLTGQGDSA